MVESGKIVNLTIFSHLLVCHRAIMACWKGNQSIQWMNTLSYTGRGIFVSEQHLTTPSWSVTKLPAANGSRQGSATE